MSYKEPPMLKIYCYPRCTTCQRATKYLDAKSVEYEYINIKENNPDKETLRSLWQKKRLRLEKVFQHQRHFVQRNGTFQKTSFND